MRRTTDPATAASPRPGGFTLTELLIVIVIIGIIVAFVMGVAIDGLRRAEERGTQALITKLESALADRLESLMVQSPTVNNAHRFLASVFVDSGGSTPYILPGDQRAQVIARADLIKSEMPDAFFVRVDPTTLTRGSTEYPLSFAGVPYPSSASAAANFVLPLGHAVPAPIGDGLSDGGTGIYGASYAVAAGIYKNLGYHADGYDGADNNGNSLIDEWAEGVARLTDPEIEEVRQRLLSHQLHDGNVEELNKTARSEMLYALLVESQGPLGNMFTPDDFTDREVADTDGDNLPEFVDAWGQPIQFFRWPTHYVKPAEDTSGAANATDQKGYGLYRPGEPRQQNSLDPNQTLVAPAWWSSTVNNQAGAFSGLPIFNPQPLGMSGQAAEFMRQFFSLVDSFAGQTLPPSTQLWDRSGGFARRAYQSRFLVISPGPDKRLGIGQLAMSYPLVDDRSYVTGVGFSARDTSGPPVNANAPLAYTLIENQAAPVDPNRSGALNYQLNLNPVNDTFRYLQSSGLDDISNHNIQAPGGGVR